MRLYIELAVAFLCLVVQSFVDKPIIEWFAWTGLVIFSTAALWEFGNGRGWVRKERLRWCGILIGGFILATFLIPFSKDDMATKSADEALRGLTKGDELPTKRAISELVIDSSIEPPTIMPQANKVCPAKVARLARLRLKNAGTARITHAELVMIRGNDFEFPIKLPVSSTDSLFDCRYHAPAEVSVDLNPGDDAFFDAVVECNGRKCPEGSLAVPSVYEGRVRFYVPIVKNVERFSYFTVRASSNRAEAVTTAFDIVRGDDASILLKRRP